MDNDAEEFEDIEELSDLYEEIRDDAYDVMTNGLMENPEEVARLVGEGYTFEDVRKYVTDNFDITVDYPEIE